MIMIIIIIMILHHQQSHVIYLYAVLLAKLEVFLHWDFPLIQRVGRIKDGSQSWNIFVEQDFVGFESVCLHLRGSFSPSVFAPPLTPFWWILNLLSPFMLSETLFWKLVLLLFLTFSSWEFSNVNWWLNCCRWHLPSEYFACVFVGDDSNRRITTFNGTS